jgi:hypothetical protein
MQTITKVPAVERYYGILVVYTSIGVHACRGAVLIYFFFEIHDNNQVIKITW